MTSFWQHDFYGPSEEKLEVNKKFSPVELCQVLLIAGKQALELKVQEEVDQPLTDFISQHKHELFHLHTRRRCCRCDFTKISLTNCENSPPCLSWKDWSSLFVPTGQKCDLQRHCSCQYEHLREINLHSLGIHLLICILLNICNIPQDEKLKVNTYKDALRSVTDFWENLYNWNTYAAENIVLGMVGREDNRVVIKSKIRDLRSKPYRYYEELKEYMIDLVKEKRRAANDTELFISTLVDTPGSSVTVSQFRRKVMRSKSLQHEHIGYGKITEFGETAEYTRNCRFYPLESFPHFQYVYNLVFDCYCRLMETNELCPDELGVCNMKPEHDLVIKVDFVGTLTEERLNLVSDRKGKDKRMGKMAWSESPLICFLQKDTKIHSMRACHTLVVVNNLENLKKKRIDSQVQVIEHNEKKIRKAISVCIEKGIQNYIEKLINIIKHSKNNSSEDLIDFHMELKAISKHVILEENTYQHAFKRNDFFSIPQEIRDLLSREPHVNSFGIWEDATFKIFMDETLDADILKEKLKRKYQTFFEKHRLHIERKKFIMKCATQLKQGGELRKPSPSGENVECGTLGGFVKDTKSSESCSEAYALTCNHLYPSTNDPAYANIDGEEKEIGKCIFTTRENSCDFAVIEISKDFSDKCDLEFRRDDEKSCNAEVSEFFPIHVGIVHKNGSKTNWTRGRVVSRAFYDVVNKRESFVVKGLGCPFSTPGDSGSIVFARDNSVSQYAVDVLGMVYSNHPDIRDDTSQPENEKVDEASGHSEINLKSGTDQCYSTDGGKTKSDQIRAKIMKNPENYSFCFRMNNAFELLEKEKNLLVSFERVVNLDERDDD